MLYLGVYGYYCVRNGSYLFSHPCEWHFWGLANCFPDLTMGSHHMVSPECPGGFLADIIFNDGNVYECISTWKMMCCQFCHCTHISTRVIWLVSHLLTWINLSSTWTCNYIRYQKWDEITYPSTNLNGTTIEVWQWISDLILHLTGYVITYLYWIEVILY